MKTKRCTTTVELQLCQMALYQMIVCHMGSPSLVFGVDIERLYV